MYPHPYLAEKLAKIQTEERLREAEADRLASLAGRQSPAEGRAVSTALALAATVIALLIAS